MSRDTGVPMSLQDPSPMHRINKCAMNNVPRVTAGKLIALGIVIYLGRLTMAHFRTQNSLRYSTSSSTNEPKNRTGTKLWHQHRPLIHFSPSKNWINDPNGLVYYDGEWHLFYQHYPLAPSAINMHWGHSVSRDLITWTESPIAIAPEDDIVGIWSGSVVIDWQNVTGFQRRSNIHPMIAIYTWQKQRWQEQHMAYSVDRGRTWTKYRSNPIIPLYNNVSSADRLSNQITRRPFRDPKVTFHTPTASWILVLTGGDHVQFYRSLDLIHWSLTSQFGFNDGSHGGTWECPDLIEFTRPTIRNQTSLWVLLVSVQNSAPAEGSGMQYFVGTFDGVAFRNIHPPQTIHWLDFGPDFYAGITFHNVPRYDGRQIIISWMNNWRYAREVPTAPLWRGQMTIPRQLHLDWNPWTKTYHLRQVPVHELHAYSKRLISIQRQKLSAKPSRHLALNVSRDVYLLDTQFHNITETTTVHLRVRQTTDRSEYTAISFIGTKNSIEFDRSRSGNVDFVQSYPVQFSMPLDKETLTTGKLQLQLLVDRCSVELFVNNGKYTMTALIFPKSLGYQLELSVDGSDIWLNYLELMLISL